MYVLTKSFEDYDICSHSVLYASSDLEKLQKICDDLNVKEKPRVKAAEDLCEKFQVLVNKWQGIPGYYKKNEYQEAINVFYAEYDFVNNSNTNEYQYIIEEVEEL